jgi:hypothetical protein
MDTRPAPTAHGARSAAGSFWIWLCTLCPARGADWIPPAPRLEDATEKWPFSAARAAASTGQGILTNQTKNMTKLAIPVSVL